MAQQRSWSLSIIAALVWMFVFTPPSQAGIAHEESVTGGSSFLTSATTSSPLTGVTNHLYLAAISTRPNKVVQSVTGLGFTTWTRVAQQCSGNDDNRVEIWYAIGTPAPSGTVTCTVADGVLNIAMVVSRYSGVDKDLPIEAVATANVLGVGGNCGAASQTSSYSFNLTTTAPSSQVYAAAATCRRTHTPVSGVVTYTQRQQEQQGTGTDIATVAVMDGVAPVAASTVAVSGSLSGTANWAVAAIELHPAQVHPRLFFTAADLPALQAAWQQGSNDPERQAIYQTLLDTSAPWASFIPTDPGGSDSGYLTLAWRMTTMAFLYELDGIAEHRDKALEIADKLVQIHQSRGGVGGWGGTVPCVPPACNDVVIASDWRDTGLSYCIRYMAAVYDWLYDYIPVTVQGGNTYRTKAQYAQAINEERLRMGYAIQHAYTTSMGNWWPNQWTQNHNTENFTAFSTATWGLQNELFLSPAARAQVLLDLPIADDAMTRIKQRYDELDPDGGDGEGYHYMTVGLAALMHGLHVERKVKGPGGPDNWPHTFLNAFADWMVANILDGRSRSFLVKQGDLAGNDPPDQDPTLDGAVGIGHQAVSLAHVAAAEATDAAQKAKLQWAAGEFGAQEYATTGRTHRLSETSVLDYVIEYLEYDSSITPSATPTAKRYSFPDRHVYVWTQGFESTDAKVASVGGSYTGDHSIDLFGQTASLAPSPWNPSYVQTSAKMNIGHSHEDAGQYYFRIGHTELTTEYAPQALIVNGNVSAAHNTLLIDPAYGSGGTPDQYPETTNPDVCGQYHPDRLGPNTSNGDEGITIAPTKATVPYDRWVGPSASQVTADYVVHNLAPRYQDPADQSANPTGSRLSRYDRRILWLRGAPEMAIDGQGSPIPGPVLFVQDEVDSPLPHTFEWRHHSAVPFGGTVAPNSDPLNTLPIWLVDCPDGKSLVLALAAPTPQGGESQGARFKSSTHQHTSVDPAHEGTPPHPSRFVRVWNDAPTTSTHVGFMMYPIATGSWPGPTGQPPRLTSSSFDHQNSPNALAFDWQTPGYIQSLNFMDDGPEQNGPLLVDGFPHVAAGYVAERKSDNTIAQAFMFMGSRVVDESAAPTKRNFIKFDMQGKQADILTSTDGNGQLKINVLAWNTGNVPLLVDLLDRATFYEHPTSQTYITSVIVNDQNIDTETPRRWFWAHQMIDGKPHVQLAKPGPGGSNPFEVNPPIVAPADGPDTPVATSLGAPRTLGPGQGYELSYAVSNENTPVKLEVFDLKGRRVAVVEDAVRSPGAYTVRWGGASSAGMYFLRLEAGTQRFTRKFLVLPH